MRKKFTAAEAGYMELKGAVKDGVCEIVDIPNGLSRRRGCCNEYQPEKDTEETVFRCGDCEYVGPQEPVSRKSMLIIHLAKV